MDNKPRLLVVDDDSGMRNQLKWGLDKFEVVTAQNRQDALEKFQLHQPHVVTLDLGLPPDAEGTKEGMAILQLILQRAPATRIVVVSGATEEDSAEKAVSLGAFEFYAKPVDIEQLSKIVDAAYLAFEPDQ